ncbi:hypothetical protein FXO38_01654 [Capsicum annuum]|nr:hypothetical protein FXO38_01654 [Capsicum annuum]KAF3683806.1 hypothetical protein FXO37_01671 [Capsicum annuum]
MHLFFPSLITELPKRAKVKEYVADTWVHPCPHIIPLKFRGEGAPGQSNKRNMDFEKLAQQDTDSYTPLSANPLDGISSQMKELGSHYPSYVTQSDYDIYHEEQKKQRATVAKLARAYSALVGSHKDLKESHMKMVKRETKRDKFFKKLWKRVKGIFKVHKPNNRPPLPRMDSKDKATANWYAYDADGDGAESARERRS